MNTYNDTPLEIPLKSRATHGALRRIAVGLPALVLCWPLLAVADCVDGSRKPSPGELDFYQRAMSALIAALPPVPAGVRQNGGSDINNLSNLGWLCAGPQGHKTGQFDIRAERFYVLGDQEAAVRISINMVKLPTTAPVPFAAYGATSPGQSAALRVNNVVWSVGGKETPLRQTLADAVDRAYLQALVGAPLPSIAESRTRAAQATPATTPAGTVAPTAPLTQTAPSTPAAAQPAPASAPVIAPTAPPSQAGAADPVRDAVDTVNKLRGLFGR